MPRVLRDHPPIDTRSWMPEPLSPTETLESVKHQATRIATDAQLQADAMLLAAQAEAEQIRQEAYQQGLAEGQAVGERTFDAHCDELQELCLEVATERDAFFVRAEPELIRLAVAIAERIVTQQLTLNPELIVDIVRTHLQQVRDQEHLQVRISPEDLPLLEDARADFQSSAGSPVDCDLVVDRRVGRGGVMFDTAGGSLDARVATKFSLVKAGIHAMLEGVRGHRES